MSVLKLFHNIGMLLVARGFNIVQSILIMSIIARYLSVELFGKYALATDTIFIVVPLLKFGLSQILVREIARDRVKAAENVFIVLAIRTLIFAIIATAIVVVAESMAIDSQIRFAIYLAAISEFLFTLVGMSTDVFIGYERMKYVSILITVNRFLILVATIAVAYFDWGFYNLFTSAIAINIVSTILGFYMMLSKFIVPKVSFDKERIRFFLREAYVIGLAAFFIEISFRMDTFFLTARGYDEVAFFGVPLRIVSRLMILSVVITESTLPVFSRLAKISHKETLDFLSQSFKYIIIILLPVCVLFTFFPEEIITLIFSDKFVQSVPSMRIMIWVFLFFSVIMYMGNVLIAINRQNITVGIMLFGILINLAADIYLIPLYGHVGASIGKFFSFGVMAFGTTYFVIKRLGMFQFSKSVLRPGLCALACGALIYALVDFNSILGVASGGVVYCGGLFATRSISVSELMNFGKIVGKA